LNVIFIQYLIIYLFIYWGDSATADRAFATRFFLSYQAFVFQFECTQKEGSAQIPRKSGLKHSIQT